MTERQKRQAEVRALAVWHLTPARSASCHNLMTASSPSPPSPKQVRDDRRAAAATSKKRKIAASQGEASTSTAPPPKRRSTAAATATQSSLDAEAMRLAAAKAAGVAAAQRIRQGVESESSRQVAEAARQEADAAAERAMRLEGQAAAQLRAAAASEAAAADQRALLRLQVERDERARKSVIEEYVELKASMMRMKAHHLSRTGHKMSDRSAPQLYRDAQARREKLASLFPGRPWVKHPDYIRLQSGEMSVGCAPVPTVARPTTAAQNMSAS